MPVSLQWRSELDDQMTMGANDFNKKYGHGPGDPLYMTPELSKSWTMEETGGSANRLDFETDPLQANKFDWDDAKRQFGMYPGQQMTPMASINGGLDWLQYKADQLLRKTGGVTRRSSSISEAMVLDRDRILQKETMKSSSITALHISFSCGEDFAGLIQQHIT